MFPLTSLFSLPRYRILYPCLYVLYCLAHTASHSLLSKCWHISFKCTVFISHSLCPSPSFPPSPFFLRGESEYVLEGSIPRHLQHSFSSSYLLSSPLLLLQLSHPTFIVNNWVSASVYPKLRSSCSPVICTVWGILFVLMVCCQIRLFYQIILMPFFFHHSLSPEIKSCSLFSNSQFTVEIQEECGCRFTRQ